MNITRHVVAEMDESMIQKCVICGAIIIDNRNLMFHIKDGPPKGFPAGNLYVSTGNPKMYFTEEVYAGEKFTDCNTSL